MCRDALGEAHQDTTDFVEQLAGLLTAQGNLLQDLGKLEEAEPLYRQAWEGKRVALGPSHPSTIIYSYRLIALLKKLGRIDEARELCESELAMCRDALGEAHRGTIEFVKQLAGLREAEARLAAPPPQMPAAGQFPTYWIYCGMGGGVGVRSGPEYPGGRTGDGVDTNEEVVVVERLTKTVDGAELTFLKLWVHPDDAVDVERSGGWVFDQTPSGQTCMELVREV